MPQLTYRDNSVSKNYIMGSKSHSATKLLYNNKKGTFGREDCKQSH